MLLAVDWSGDPGMKPGSLPRCIMVVVACEDEEALQIALAELRQTRSLRKDFEFHYTKLNEDMRVAFMDAVDGMPFKAVVAVYDKEHMRPKWAWGRDTDLLVQLITHWVLALPLESLKNSKMVIDGEREVKVLKRLLRPALSKALTERGITARLDKIVPGKSESYDVIQLADMMGGAINDALKQRAIEAHTLRAVRSNVTILVLKITRDMEKPTK